MAPAKLREARLALGLTQLELGDKLGRSRDTIIRWENGHIEIPKAVDLAMKYLVGMRGK